MTAIFGTDQPSPPHSRLPVPLLSLVIPTFNEAETVVQVLQQLLTLTIDIQIIVVDDGSNDGTRGRILNFLGPSELVNSKQTDADGALAEFYRAGDTELQIITHHSNRGKGAALRTGFRAARGEYILVQDADLEYDPQDIPRLLEPLTRGEADVVYGSRFLNGRHGQLSWPHRWGNWFLTSASNWFSGAQLTDMETCYKAFRSDLLGSMVIQQNRFGVEPELTAKFLRRGVRLVEIPVSYRARNYSQGKKIGVRDLWQTLYCIVRYGIRD
ncbi:MAG TPA: glycosyltransferase family 2 protein [Pirellulaceae bacterium]|nr:glycosyltransferase family 2 protein [Pirellulaceae bacterium]